MECLIFLKQIFLSLLSWCIIVPLSLLGFIYRAIIAVILKRRFKGKYGGLVTKQDTLFHSSPFVDVAYISAVLYIKADHQIDLQKEIWKIIQEKVFDNPENYPKLTSSVHTFGGFIYYIKNNVQISEVLKTYEVPCDVSLTEEYVKEVLGKVIDWGCLSKNSALWEIHVVPRPLDDKSPDGLYRYVMILRAHHSLGDGISLMTLLVQLFGDAPTQNFSYDLYDKLFKDRYAPKITKNMFIPAAVKMWRNLLNILEMFFISPGRIIQIEHLQPKDQNQWRNSQFSGEKYVAWSKECKTECFPMVKSIKNSTDTKVSSVLITAIYESILAYCERTSLAEPKDFSAFMTIRTKPPFMENLKPVPLENYTSYALLNFPTELKSESALKNLKVLTQETFSKIRTSDVLFAIQMMEYLIGYMPIFLVDQLLRMDNGTFIISIVPGGSPIKILDGCILEHIVPLLPLLHGFSIAFAVVTYDDRLQVSVVADKNVIRSSKELQKIADDVLHFIKVIDSESKDTIF
ncbi:uncharacterized protein [Euwallacea fornicatus]|uniref:uncharacterized protein n=1 Tax=Euwallacea fornicatus TaxID=995702 RepID=UPI0033906A0E